VGSYPYGLDVIGLLMMIYAVHERTTWLCFWGMSSCTECQMQHWVAVHKFECHGPEPGSPGSLDTDSQTFSEVHSPGISRSENHRVFVDFTDTSNVNEVGPPAQVLLNPDGPTQMQQKLQSWTVTSNGQQRAKVKKVCWEKLTWKLLSTFGFALSNPQTVLNSSAQYGYKEYLSKVDNAQLRRSLARFRCANHKLQIELGRQVKPVKVPVQQRYCKLCDLGAVEDEDHFLLVCPAYQSVRERFRGSLPLTAITPLAELLSCQQQGILARFLVQCRTVRSELLH
jgi:hypothetical protein